MFIACRETGRAAGFSSAQRIAGCPFFVSIEEMANGLCCLESCCTATTDQSADTRGEPVHKQPLR